MPSSAVTCICFLTAFDTGAAAFNLRDDINSSNHRPRFRSRTRPSNTSVLVYRRVCLRAASLPHKARPPPNSTTSSLLPSSLTLSSLVDFFSLAGLGRNLVAHSHIAAHNPHKRCVRVPAPFYTASRTVAHKRHERKMKASSYLRAEYCLHRKNGYIATCHSGAQHLDCACRCIPGPRSGAACVRQATYDNG